MLQRRQAHTGTGLQRHCNGQSLHEGMFGKYPFQKCYVPKLLESHELLKQSDRLKHNNEKVLLVSELSTLDLAHRLYELWPGGLIRIFTDGSVDFPTDERLARGGG